LWTLIVQRFLFDDGCELFLLLRRVAVDIDVPHDILKQLVVVVFKAREWFVGECLKLTGVGRGICETFSGTVKTEFVEVVGEGVLGFFQFLKAPKEVDDT
jgi:hypothetical protein